jgi:predicted HTH domain antitoxin
MNATVTLEVPEEAVRLFGGDRFGAEVLEAAAVRWFEEGRLSQGQAAHLLKLTRGEFFDVLERHHVSPVQLDEAELEAELRG